MRQLVVVLALLTGCDLYLGHNGDDVCNYGAADDVAEPAPLHDPYSGQCESVGGYDCPDTCGPCAYDTAGALPNQDWASCYSQCTGLSESTCLTTSGCQATYGGGLHQGSGFDGCYATAPSGPVSTGTCDGLDAHECSRHDNCSLFYGTLPNDGTGPFDHCGAEPTANSCSDVDCGTGSHCQDQCNASGACNAMCVPDGDVCAAVDCGPGYMCVETCVDPSQTHAGQCYGTCQVETACGALPSEAACTARGDCTPVYDGMDCTCTPAAGCTCAVETYDHCQTR